MNACSDCSQSHHLHCMHVSRPLFSLSSICEVNQLPKFHEKAALEVSSLRAPKFGMPHERREAEP